MRRVLALVLTILATVALSARAQSLSYPPPGRLVDLGGRALHISCTGQGTPTVVLIAGGGAYSIDWALVQAPIAQRTRVCAYDRAGLAWSDPGPADETIEQTVADLHALLAASKEPGPYVLVGASIAGLYIRAYQRAFPGDVAALVFTNSSNRVGITAKSKAGLLWELTEEDIQSAYPLPASAKGPAPAREGSPFDRLSPDLQAVRLWLDVRNWERFKPEATRPTSMLSWRREFIREFDETDAGQPPLGMLPVVVVSSTGIASDAERRSRDGAMARLDFLSTNAVHITADGSGHEIHLFQPDRVVEGVAKAVTMIRSRNSQ
jgi:pimeloyl-ACP methyl ester carboxylesterase